MMRAMRGLLIIDIQNDYFPGGAFPLVGPGMMSSMCVDATVRAGADLGFGMTVIHDGCAAPDLEFGGRQVDGASVHAAFMAALGDGYATLVGSGELPSR